MTISFFLFIAVLLVLLLWVWRVLSSDGYLWQSDNSRPSRVVVVVAFLFLGICAAFTLNKYIYPKDQSVYGNAKYHAIRHKGFRFNDSLTLVVNSDYVNKANSALWDSKVGDVTLSHEQIIVNDYPEPFYFKPEGADIYSLHNRPFEKKFDTIMTIAIGNKQLFQLTMKEHDKNKVEYTFTKPGTNEKFVSNFTKKIKKGYPLLDIIVQTPNFTVDTVDNIDINTLLEGTYLVRTEIYADKDKLVDTSKIVLFPGRDLLIVDSLRVNDELCDPNPEREDIKVGKGVSFFSGLGNKRTSIYTLRPSAKDSTTMELFYALPKMYSLRDSVSNRVFLTSSVAGVLENADMGGYYFNILDNEDNQNHINGQLRYKTGNAREPLSFEVFDFYSDNPTNKKSLAAGDEFELNIRGGEVSKKTNGQRDEKIEIHKDVKWVFDVEDLRATNPMQWSDIFIYLAIFLALVCLRILWDFHSESPSLSFFEITAYVVVFAFLVVRLILSWRSSTFVPTDGVTVAVFNKMRASVIDYNLLKLGNIRTYIPFLFPVAMMLRGWVSRLYYRIVESETWYNLSNKWDRIITKLREWVSGLYYRVVECKVVSVLRRFVSFIGLDEVYDYIKLRFADKKGYLLLAYVVLLAVAFVLSKFISEFERVFNIPLPIISYLLADRWLSKRDDSVLVRVFVALLAFGYIFLVDAGFSIVLVIYHLFMWMIVEPLCSVESWWKRAGCCIGGVVAIFVVLCFEGDMMMWIFENVKLFLGIVFTIITLLTTACLWRSDEVSGKAVTGWATTCTIVFVIVMVVFSGTIAKMVQKKEHMKYRAEIQKLDRKENVSKLMINCDFDSSDITYIMRSAHNQWFINQYLKAGRDAEAMGRYFTIQPHSKQGSTYNTQTTDLVVARYVLAEHSRWVIVWLLVLLGMLVVMFFVDGAMDKQKNRVMFGGILLLFLLALLVYLSATNRIVFIGQDFPFLSIQSLVAVLLPISLITIAALSLSNDCSNKDNDDQIASGSKILQGVSLLVLAAVVMFIPKNGSEIEDNQFDVSAIYATLSEKVRILDKQMRIFQRENKGASKKSKDEFWADFKESKNHYDDGTKAFTAADNPFYKTLLDYFENKQPNKNDPDKLLHLKRRNGRWTMAVNKKHYFIPSMIDKAHQWQGNLYAANVGCDLLILNANNDKELDRQIVDNEKEREINNQNILDTYEDITKIVGKINMFNVSVTRFDKEWSADQQPIVLLSSSSGGRSSDSQQSFNIETPEISILGTGDIEQAAMRVHLGDYVVLNKGYAEERAPVSTWRYISEPERHLARNVWINGRQKLFYPLGKESMWSYQFANTVSHAFAKSDTTRYQDLRTSIDYDLMVDFYKFFEKDNCTELNISQSLKDDLLEFKGLDYNQMQNKNNRTKFYYDRETESVKYNGRARNIDNILARVNRNLRDTEKAEKRAVIADAVSKSLEKSYTFSAVALDGNGRIRLLFDHNKHRNVDPNNSRHINELISDLYKDGSVGEENDVFGCKALLTMESGPGSTFKPVVYTAVTSQKKINWQNISVVYADKMPRREITEEEKKQQKKSQSQRPVLAYGGIACKDAGCSSLNIDNSLSTIESNKYLVISNNLFHSLVVMLGLQSDTQFGKVMRPLTAAEKQRRGTGVDTLLHPIFNLDGTLRTLNPQVWFGDEGERFIKKNEATILSTGLNDNFQIGSFADNKYQNVFGKGDAIFDLLYREAESYKCWTYPQSCAIGLADMGREPKLVNGFNQLLLGANPLEMTPLAMCEAVMRLATLNSAENLTTLSDTVTEVRDVKPFTYDDNWKGEDRYFNFYKTEVLSQLKKVPTSGTAAGLRSSIRGNYHIYAKTGTLDVESNAGERMKHLIVIIAKRPLEEATSVAELRKIKYYALYLSYMNIKLDTWNDDNAYNEEKNQRFASLINKVIDSETFKDYMKD